MSITFIMTKQALFTLFDSSYLLCNLLNVFILIAELLYIKANIILSVTDRGMCR